MKVKSYAEINERISRGEALVLTALEFKELAGELSPAELVDRVDVVTTATFAPMCSSGALLNFGHAEPPIRMERITLNGVPAYEGLAAVDAYLGATAVDPGDEAYGGAHVIEALVRGEEVELVAEGKGTDCYPRRRIVTRIAKDRINEAWLLNPRNAYQNYGAAANGSDAPIRTYMGILEPKYATLSYSTSGELSPLLNDPECRTVGVGTPVFLGGALGRVISPGTQYNDMKARNASGLPLGGARTLALWGDLKEADPEFLAAAHYSGYGVSLFLGIGLPVPVLDEDMARRLSVRDWDIQTEAWDYARSDRPKIGTFSYAELRSGSVELQGRRARTSSLSSLGKARRICEALRERVISGSFPIEAPVAAFPRNRSPRKLSELGPLPSSAQAGLGGAPGLGLARYRRERCVHCGACAAHCSRGALSIGAPDWNLVYAAARCDGCGACFPACPRGALGGAAPRAAEGVRHG